MWLSRIWRSFLVVHIVNLYKLVGLKKIQTEFTQRINPFDTLRFGKIRLFEWPNRDMLIRATRCHEFTLQDQVLKCGSAGATLGFQWH